MAPTATERENLQCSRDKETPSHPSQDISIPDQDAAGKAGTEQRLLFTQQQDELEGKQMPHLSGWPNMLKVLG